MSLPSSYKVWQLADEVALVSGISARSIQQKTADGSVDNFYMDTKNRKKRYINTRELFESLQQGKRGAYLKGLEDTKEQWVDRGLDDKPAYPDTESDTEPGAEKVIYYFMTDKRLLEFIASNNTFLTNVRILGPTSTMEDFIDLVMDECESTHPSALSLFVEIPKNITDRTFNRYLSKKSILLEKL